MTTPHDTPETDAAYKRIARDGSISGVMEDMANLERDRNRLRARLVNLPRTDEGLLDLNAICDQRDSYKRQLAGAIEQAEKECCDWARVWAQADGELTGSDVRRKCALFLADRIRSLAEPAEPVAQPEPVYVIFDGPPGPTSGHFIEVETVDGKSVSVGEWEKVGDYWRLGPLYAAPVAPSEDAERFAFYFSERTQGDPQLAVLEGRWNKDDFPSLNEWRMVIDAARGKP